MSKSFKDDLARKLVVGMLDGGPYIVIIAAFIITVVALLALLLVDVYTGQLTGEYILRNLEFSIASSLATTGLITAVIAVIFKGVDRKWSKEMIWGLGLAATLLIGMDTYLDAMSVDIARFGAIVTISQHMGDAQAEVIAHTLFRILIGGVSLVGEPLAGAAIAIFPALKDVFEHMVDTADVVKSRVNTPVYRPFAPSSKPSTSTQFRPTAPDVRSSHPQQSAARTHTPTYHPVGIQNVKESDD